VPAAVGQWLLKLMAWGALLNWELMVHWQVWSACQPIESELIVHRDLRLRPEMSGGMWLPGSEMTHRVCLDSWRS